MYTIFCAMTVMSWLITGSWGAARFGEILLVNASLHTLDLSSNDIGAGADAMRLIKGLEVCWHQQYTYACRRVSCYSYEFSVWFGGFNVPTLDLPWFFRPVSACLQEANVFWEWRWELVSQIKTLSEIWIFLPASNIFWRWCCEIHHLRCGIFIWVKLLWAQFSAGSLFHKRFTVCPCFFMHVLISCNELQWVCDPRVLCVFVVVLCVILFSNSWMNVWFLVWPLRESLLVIRCSMVMETMDGGDGNKRILFWRESCMVLVCCV